jgi:hypothetical protein
VLRVRLDLAQAGASLCAPKRRSDRGKLRQVRQPCLDPHRRCDIVRQDSELAVAHRYLELRRFYCAAHIDRLQNSPKARFVREFDPAAKLHLHASEQLQRHGSGQKPQAQLVQTVQERPATAERAAAPLGRGLRQILQG